MSRERRDVFFRPLTKAGVSVSVKEFVNTSTGKGIAGMVLTSLIVAWPLIFSWSVAAVSFAFGAYHLSKSYRKLRATRPAACRRMSGERDAASSLDGAATL
jgi:hypothetical protein